MISGLNSSTIDANTVGSGSVKGAHKRPDAEEMFKKMDSDGDGSVSEQEFESTMVSISPQGANAADSADAQARAATEFKKTDTDGDGKVSESELAAGMKAHEAEHQGQAQAAGSNGGTPHGAPPAGGGGSQAQGVSPSSSQTYDPADTNKDGKVSEQEAQAYATKQTAQNAAKAAVKSYDEISSLSGGTQSSQAAE